MGLLLCVIKTGPSPTGHGRMEMTFETLASAEAFVLAEALPFAAIEVFDISWINGSPVITYFVRLPR